MNSPTTQWFKDHITLFQVFKYTIYVLLIRNIFLFYFEEQAAAIVLEADGVAWTEILDVYAATIDTLSWVILLLMFELETYLIPDDKITRPVQVTFTAIRSICYLWIVFALVGYSITYLDLIKDWSLVAATASDLCMHIGNSFMYSLERFTEISQQNCSLLATSDKIYVAKEIAFTDAATYRVSWILAVADVVNATAWILVVVILEAEVWLQNNKTPSPYRFGLVNIAKSVLYLTLVVVATIWWFYGEFIDFWDAFLWIVAFLFIESNLFEWSKEKLAESKSLST